MNLRTRAARHNVEPSPSAPHPNITTELLAPLTPTAPGRPPALTGALLAQLDADHPVLAGVRRSC